MKNSLRSRKITGKAASGEIVNDPTPNSSSTPDCSYLRFLSIEIKYPRYLHIDMSNI